MNQMEAVIKTKSHIYEKQQDSSHSLASMVPKERAKSSEIKPTDEKNNL